MKKKLMSIVLGAVMAILRLAAAAPARRSRAQRQRKRRQRLRLLQRQLTQPARISTSVSLPVRFPSPKTTDAERKLSRRSTAKRT